MKRSVFLIVLFMIMFLALSLLPTAATSQGKIAIRTELVTVTTVDNVKLDGAFYSLYGDTRSNDKKRRLFLSMEKL